MAEQEDRNAMGDPREAWREVRRDVLHQFAVRARDRLSAQQPGFECRDLDNFLKLGDECTAEEARRYIALAESVMQRCIDCLVDELSRESTKS